MKSVLSSLFVNLLSNDDDISIPIDAIKIMRPDSEEPYKTRILLKSDYFFYGHTDLLIDYSIKTVTQEINQTIELALKQCMDS